MAQETKLRWKEEEKNVGEGGKRKFSKFFIPRCIILASWLKISLVFSFLASSVGSWVGGVGTLW